MLGEDHSLLTEFPKSKATISSLIDSNASFAIDTKRYDHLDRKIRTLELSNSPIEDGAMHALKHERSQLKDALYQHILDAEK
ncbi:YdcH family protein [uncultured Vibrio sp.]|uniref:YdcH family protein n=1 Tax=uncultured Vibrio sp. TaxID=114054 RepID=UPI0025FB0FB5|nr:YdcH family protein [uncultured Vibrio sp.]